MLTLQILDAGQEFLITLEEGRPLSLGSSETSDVRLRSAGVASVHANVVPVQKPDRVAFKIVAAEGSVFVNDEDVMQAVLGLGDRVRLGDASFVLGQQVRRAATAADVLQDRPSRRRQNTSGGRAFAVLAVVLLLAVGGAGYWFLNSSDARPAELVQVDTLRAKGRFDEAQSIIDGLRGWADGREVRLAHLREAEDELAASRGAYEQGRVALRSAGRTQSRAQLIRELRDRERGGDPADAEVARLLRRDLEAILEGVVQKLEASTGPVPVAQDTQPNPSDDFPGESVEPQDDGADVVLTVVEEQVARGEFVQAIETLRSGIATVDADASRRLLVRLEALKREVRETMNGIVANADALADGGDLAGAVAMLDREAWRFPAIGDLNLVHRELGARRIEMERRNAPAPSRRDPVATNDPTEPAGKSRLDATTLTALQAHLRRIRDAELSGEYELVARLCGEAADAVRRVDGSYALRLAGKADDFAAIAALTERLGGKLARQLQKKGVSVPMAGGQGTVTAVEGRGVRIVSGEGDEPYTWLELPGTAVFAIADAVSAEPEIWLGVGALAYRTGDRATAENAIKRAVTADEGLLTKANGILQRGRGDRIDERGYRVVKGEFVAVRDIEAGERAKKLQSSLAKLLRRGDEKATDDYLEGLLAEGPEALDAAVLALKNQRARIEGEIGKLGLKKRWDTLATLREDLDVARQHAIDLIYDEERYFYPFRPPQVSAEKAAEYWDVQAEVDRRVAALRKKWEADVGGIRMNDKAGKLLLQVQWLNAKLIEFGSVPTVAEHEATEWVRSLPKKGEALTLQNFARSEAERHQMDKWAAIVRFNEKELEQVSDGERRQFLITNAYRAMFAHRPLAANLKLFEAARGHSDEMSTLGYFSHFSPTEGRRSPGERMRLAGYNFGVSENIAKNSSSLGAHNAWLHSSGHHRNLLNPKHKEFGVGISGAYYTQNFGRSDEFEDRLQ